METLSSLQNHFLIAMPNLDDPFFQRSVTYICEHNEDGAMGLVVNQPVDLTVGSLLKQLEIVVPDASKTLDLPVYAGGPLARDRGFVLHAPVDHWRSSLRLSDDVMITTSKDILESMGQGTPPEKFILTLGYAGWDAGQLEQELAENSWLTIPADPDILFNTPVRERWQKAAARLGIDVWQLGPDVGHA
ncbi:MAG TPA: YqgE/AlgH family protein [Pseudidiomarina sp.]|nr:YqgE/AlgH family protein [Pseudidiomarina sp.]